MQVTPEIIRELDSSRNRGEKEGDLVSIYILCFVKSITLKKYIYFEVFVNVYFFLPGFCLNLGFSFAFIKLLNSILFVCYNRTVVKEDIYKSFFETAFTVYCGL